MLGCPLEQLPDLLTFEGRENVPGEEPAPDMSLVEAGDDSTVVN